MTMTVGGITLSGPPAVLVLFFFTLGAAVSMGFLWRHIVGRIGEVVTHKALAAIDGRHEAELTTLRAELERLGRRVGGEVDHIVYVSRVQFDQEFRALRKLWACLASVRRDLFAVRPYGRIVDPNETPEDELRERLDHANALGRSLNDLRAASDLVEPFLPQEIYDAAMEARMIASSEHTDIALESMPTHDQARWWARGEEHRERYQTKMQQIAALYRQRLGMLRVIPEDRH